MEKKMIHDTHSTIDNKKIWYETKDPDFIDLSFKSMVKPSWMSYQEVLNGPYKDSIVKPLNNYVQNIGHQPSLLSINGDEITIRYHLAADMFLLKQGDEPLYHVDRLWMRQYYNTSYSMPEQEDCFEGTYKFFVPWFIDANVEVTYLQPSVESAFLINKETDFWHQPPRDADLLQPHFVYFKFKNTGSHMEDHELGIPRRGDPMFDMTFRGDAIIVDRIKEQYANN